VIAAGTTFIWPDEPGPKKHLYFVISEETLFAQVAIANLTSRRDPCDTSCIVARGEHPFVSEESIVAYNYARIVEVDEFHRRVKDGVYRIRDDALSAELLLRIQKAALESPHTIGKVTAAVEWTLNAGAEEGQEGKA